MKKRAVSLLGGKGNSRQISMTIGIENERLSVMHAKLYKRQAYPIMQYSRFLTKMKTKYTMKCFFTIEIK